MVNLIGSERASATRVDLDRELPPHVKNVLPTRLDEARRWWAGLDAGASPMRRARTPALEPDLEDESSLAALEAALIGLVERRAASLAGVDPAPTRAPDAPTAKERAAHGRLLVCELDMSIGGGEAEAASQGVLDVDDRPPWDLWLVAWGRTHASRPEEPITAVLAWIPDALVPLVQAGIEACPTRCLYWAE